MTADFGEMILIRKESEMADKKKAKKVIKDVKEVKKEVKKNGSIMKQNAIAFLQMVPEEKPQVEEKKAAPVVKPAEKPVKAEDVAADAVGHQC